ncbi:MAG TPA: peroxiredoxin-like family protein [Gammaproteobacteria bacterium]|nr:peroxiredoxin-like family protein [Gammaproteobacteria bacterium]
MNEANHYGRLLACGLLMLLTAGRLCAGPDAGSYRETRDAWLAEKAAKEAQAPFSESEQEVMQRAAQDLARSLPDPGIKPGEQAPDFTLSNAYGKPVRLADRLREGPVVLVFYRGAWCPFCNLYLRTLYEQLTAIEAHGAQLLLVTPQQPDRSRKQMEEGRYRFEVLSDLDGAVMKAYRLYFELDPELVRIYTAHGLVVEDFNGPGRNVLPVPGTFVIDRDGIVRAMHADTDYKERMEPADILRALDAL